MQTLLRLRVSFSFFVHRPIFSVHTRTLTYKQHIQRLFNDGIDLKQQTVEIDPKERIRRCSLHKNDDIWTSYKVMHPNVRTLGDALKEGHHLSDDGPCIGIVRSSDGINSMEWLSYSKAREHSQYIGSYLLEKLKLTPMQSKVAILSSNRPEYLFAEQACYKYGLIVVSLYTTYDAATILNILRRTQAEVLIVDNSKRIEMFQNDLSNSDQIKEILVMDEGIYDRNGKIQSFSKIYKAINKDNFRERPIVDPNSAATFVLTSGTTGEPKIAMLSHENMLATAKCHLMRLDKANITQPLTERHCSFLPMSHVYERFIILQLLIRGAQVAFCPEPEKLREYLSIVKPTQASVVPRVLNRVYDGIMAEVNKSKVKQILVRQALREKPSFLRRFAFRKVKALFGDEIKVMITGAAPITHDVMHFFRLALDIPIMEGYGQTESAGAGASTHPIDLSYGTTGSPVPSVEIKLIDVPGSDYRSVNNQGEVCIRGPNIFKGYYGDEAKTKEVLDEDGWLHTGDVGEWTNYGALRIIDRVKHIFKLSQGKYIAPERLEDMYIRSNWIAQIFIDGISTEDNVVAIVVPDEEYVRKTFPLNDKQKTFADVCCNPKLKEIIISDLKRLADKYKLQRYEVLKNIHLHSELFSHNNGLLTVTLKTRRAEARKHFQSIIQSLYQIKHDNIGEMD